MRPDSLSDESTSEWRRSSRVTTPRRVAMRAQSSLARRPRRVAAHAGHRLSAELDPGPRCRAARGVRWPLPSARRREGQRSARIVGADSGSSRTGQHHRLNDEGALRAGLGPDVLSRHEKRATSVFAHPRDTPAVVAGLRLGRAEGPGGAVVGPSPGGSDRRTLGAGDLVAPSVVENARLLVTELVTNSLLHSRVIGRRRARVRPREPVGRQGVGWRWRIPVATRWSHGGLRISGAAAGSASIWCRRSARTGA
jgi:hypothetical protein